jgi:hypothetical protein
MALLPPTVIYQRNLDAVTQALWTGDLALILRHIAIPNQMLTNDAELIIASPDEMHLAMTDFRDTLHRLGADRYLRVCRQADFVPGRGDMISGVHDTFVLRDGMPVKPPYRNLMTLIHSADGAWRGIRIEARAENTDYPILSPDLAEAQRLDLLRLSGSVGVKGTVAKEA